jgi:hypothetical protein
MSLGAARSYNLAQVVITIGGLPLEGFGADDAVSFEPTSDLYENKVGADGEVTRSLNNDRSGTLTFTLMGTSLSNDIFNTFLQLTKAVGIGDIFPIFIKDLRSGDTLVAEQCWLNREADMSFGRVASEREWSCFAAKVTTSHGGALI